MSIVHTTAPTGGSGGTVDQTARDAAAAAAASAAGAQSIANGAATAAGGLQTRVQKIESAPYLRGSRGEAVLAANVASGATVTVTVPLEYAMPSASYSAVASIEAVTGLLGNLVVQVLDTPRTTSSVTVAVKNTSVLTAIGQGAKITVMAASALPSQ